MPKNWPTITTGTRRILRFQKACAISLFTLSLGACSDTAQKEEASQGEKTEAAMQAGLSENSAQPGKDRGHMVLSVLRDLPDSYARDAFLGSLHLTKEEQEQVKKDRERRGY